MMLLQLLTTLAILSTAVVGAETKKFESPAGFYSIEYPAEWKISRDGNIVNIFPPDERGAVTISAFHSESGDMQAFLDITRETFVNSEAVVRFLPYRKARLSGIAGEFREKEDGVWRYWIVRGVHLQHVFVLITSNDDEADLPKRRSQYMRIFDSLTLNDPKSG